MNASQLSTSHLRRNIVAFYLFQVCLGLQFFGAIWVLYLTEMRGLSLKQVTLLDGPFWLALFFLEIPTGVVADRYGRRISLICGSLLLALGALAFGAGTTYPVLVGSNFLLGVALTLCSGADAAFLFDTLKSLGREDDYARIYGRAMALVAGSGIVATLVGPPLAAATNFAVPIYATAGTSALAFLAAFTLMREPPVSESHATRPGYVAGVRTAFLTIWQSPDLRTFVPLVAVSTASLIAVFIFGQPFLQEHDVATGNVGWFLVFTQVAGLGASLLAHRVVGVIGWRGAFVLMPVLSVAILGSLASLHSLWAFPAIPAAWLAFSLFRPLSSDYLNQRVESTHRATVLSFQNLGMSAVGAPLEVGLGIFADSRGLPFAFGFAAGFTILLSVPLLAAWLRTKPPGREMTPLPSADAGAAIC